MNTKSSNLAIVLLGGKSFLRKGETYYAVDSIDCISPIRIIFKDESILELTIDEYNSIVEVMENVR